MRMAPHVTVALPDTFSKVLRISTRIAPSTLFPAIVPAATILLPSHPIPFYPIRRIIEPPLTYIHSLHRFSQSHVRARPSEVSQKIFTSMQLSRTIRVQGSETCSIHSH